MRVMGYGYLRFQFDEKKLSNTKLPRNEATKIAIGLGPKQNNENEKSWNSCMLKFV